MDYTGVVFLTKVICRTATSQPSRKYRRPPAYMELMKRPVKCRNMHECVTKRVIKDRVT